MSDLWKDVKTWLTDSTRSALKETEELARRGRIKMELLGINTALNDKFVELGGVVYELIRKSSRTSIKTDVKVKRLVAEIKELEQKLRRSDKGVIKSRREKTGKNKTVRKKTTLSKSSTASKKASVKSSRVSASGKPSGKSRSEKGMGSKRLSGKKTLPKSAGTKPRDKKFVSKKPTASSESSSQAAGKK